MIKPVYRMKRTFSPHKVHPKKLSSVIETRWCNEGLRDWAFSSGEVFPSPTYYKHFLSVPATFTSALFNLMKDTFLLVKTFTKQVMPIVDERYFIQNIDSFIVLPNLSCCLCHSFYPPNMLAEGRCCRSLQVEYNHDRCILLKSIFLDKFFSDQQVWEARKLQRTWGTVGLISVV